MWPSRSLLAQTSIAYLLLMIMATGNVNAQSIHNHNISNKLYCSPGAIFDIFGDCSFTTTDDTDADTGIPEDGTGIPEDISATCHCDKVTKECHTQISWSPPKGLSHTTTAYTVVFEKNDYTNGPQFFCFPVPKNVTKFIFDEGKGFDRNINTSYRHYFDVIAQPTKRYERNICNKTLESRILECPTDEIYIQGPDLVELDVGDSRVLEYKFVGYPQPDMVSWYFTPTFDSKHRRANLSDNPHLKITANDKEASLAFSDVTNELDGKYTCVIKNYFGKTSHKDVILHIDNRLIHKQLLVLEILGIAVGVFAMLLVTAFTVKRLRRPKEAIRLHRRCVYVSHCFSGKTQIDRLYQFTGCLVRSLPDMNVVMDETRQVEITNAGGIAQWVSEQLIIADKILVLLTKDYLNVLKGKPIDISGSVHKTWTEFHYIQSLLSESHDRNEKVVLISDNLIYNDFPEIFKGRPYYLFPENLSEITTEFQIIQMALTDTVVQN